MSRFEIVPQPMLGLVLVRRVFIADERGRFSRLFCSSELADAGWSWPIRQINHAITPEAGTVRGLHYQRPPDSEAKLVICTKGRVWDVALDLRRGSNTFLRWAAHELIAERGDALLIPPGCAHGFQALTNDVELFYLHSSAYAPQSDDGVSPQDPLVAIDWPLKISNISYKDANLRRLSPDFPGLEP